MNDAADRLELVVTEVKAETELVRSLWLARADGGVLPGWDAGAHIKIHMEDGSSRSYSLVNSSREPGATRSPTAYHLGIRLEKEGRGGSRFMHGLHVGQKLLVSPPSNNFPLRDTEGPIVLLAGGIGITPLLSMAAELAAQNCGVKLVYAGRDVAHLAFVGEIETLPGVELCLHGDNANGVFDVRGLMSSLGDSALLYVCGPLPMIDAAIAEAKELGWAEDRLNFEIFAEQGAREGDSAFEVVIASSGKRVTVEPEETILQALLSAGEDMIFDCERGDCGMCQARIVEGIADHRDYYLSDREKEANELIQICVSRSKSPVLVLDFD